jgi:hypothetical protein
MLVGQKHWCDAGGAFLTFGMEPNLLGNPAEFKLTMFPKRSPFAHESLRLLRRGARGKLYTAKLIHDKRVNVFGRRIGKAPG